MSDGKLEPVVTIALSTVGGYLMSAITFAFRAGRRDAELATKAELNDYVKRHEFQTLKDDVKADLNEIKAAQGRAEERAEKRHVQMIEALLRRGDQ